MTAVAIVCPGFPERPGGVNDHTARLRRNWSAEGVVVHVQGSTAEDPGSLAERWRASGVTGILLQYVPFLYARWGVSGYPTALARAAKAAGMRVIVFVHEPWVPPTRLPWMVLSPLQRRQLLRLVRHADRVVTAVPAWRDLLGGETEILYVGSNLGDPPPPPPESERFDAPVVFSPFASGLNWEWISAAADALDAGLVIVGADAETMRSHPQTRDWHRDRWDCRGRLPAAEALAVMARARIGLAPFEDGATGRRTSLLALLSTGIPVVMSEGHLFDPVFGRGPHAVAAARDSFVALAREAWDAAGATAGREGRLAWYRANLDLAQLDQRLLCMVASRDT